MSIMSIDRRDVNHDRQDLLLLKEDSRWQQARLVAKWQTLLSHETRESLRAAAVTAAWSNSDLRAAPLTPSSSTSTVATITWSVSPGVHRSIVHPSTDQEVSRHPLSGGDKSLSQEFSPNQCQQLWHFPPQIVVHPPLGQQQQQKLHSENSSCQDSIKARKRRRAQIRRQAYERSLVDQVAPDNDDLYARKKQATDDPLQPTATDECASLVVDSLDSPHQGQDAAALIGKTSNEGLFEETDNDTSNRPDQRSRALEDAISSLSEKLERILPAGSRPSVIRAELTSRAQGASSLSTTIQEAQLSQTASDNGDLVLSQTQHSQQSVSLWDDIQEIFHALLSKVPELERQAAESIVLLGLDRLEDSIIQGLFVNEIAAPPTEDPGSEQAFSLSYQTSLYLFHVLFFSKVRGLTATPSRLLLDAIQNAARLHARAVVDGILLPLTEQNESTLTKVHTELIFNVLKSQAPTTLVHFLGEWLTSLTNPGTQKDRHEQQQQYDVALQRYLPTRLQSLLMHRSSSFSSTGSHSRTAPGDLHSSFSIPTCLSSDIQISLLQSIISLPVLSKSPLPSRLWHQLNENLEVLWTAINTLISRGSQPLLDSSKAQLAWVKALYLPNLSIPLKTPVSEGMRLSNAKLPPILVLWIMRHGPSCQDTAILQQLQQFCEAKLDVKSGKPILAKIEALLKKKAK